jgi:putative aldouronate transport system permease protein
MRSSYTSQKNTLVKTIRRQHQLLFMSIPIVLYVILFSYVPLWGWIMAFQNYKPAKTFFEQEWAGLRWFKFLFSDKIFWNSLRNTIAMSLINMVLGYISAIVLSLLLNEMSLRGASPAVS